MQQVQPQATAALGLARRASAADILRDINAGTFEEQLSVVLAQAAGSAVAYGGKTGSKVTIELQFVQIGQSNQVQCIAKMTAKMPTAIDGRGEIIERRKTDTPFHVGTGGLISLTPVGQEDMFRHKD